MSIAQEHTLNPQQFVNQLSDHLFWDVDKCKIDAQRSQIFIIQRVLEYGFTKDWNATLAFYGPHKIVENAKKMRSLETKAMHFVSKLFNVKLEDFRCYTYKQSSQNFWPG